MVFEVMEGEKDYGKYWAGVLAYRVDAQDRICSLAEQLVLPLARGIPCRGHHPLATRARGINWNGNLFVT